MMDEREGKRDLIGLFRKVVELAMPNLRSYYRMTRKAKIVGVYASDGQYYADVQTLRNDESVDDSEPVVPRVALPVLWGGPDRGLVCPPTVGTLCDLGFYDGDPNYPFISNIRYGLGRNAPKAELNELVIQLEPGVEIRIDREKRVVTLTPQNICNEAGKDWTVKAGQVVTVEAQTVLIKGGQSVTLEALNIYQKGNITTCGSSDGKGQSVQNGDLTINGNLIVNGNSYAKSRSGGKF